MGSEPRSRTLVLVPDLAKGAQAGTLWSFYRMTVILRDSNPEIRRRAGEQEGSDSSEPVLCQPQTQQCFLLTPR